MGPIEMLWGTLILVFILVTLIRGYTRELGITVLLLLVLFVELYFGTRIEALLRQKVFGQVFRLLNVNPSKEFENFLLVMVYVGLLILVLYIGYEGRSLTFPGTPKKGLEGALISTFIGAVNGWLFTGTLWYYLDKYHYPYLVKWGLLTTTWTDRAKVLMKYLPPKLFEPKPEVLAVFAAVLIFISVRR